MAPESDPGTAAPPVEPSGEAPTAPPVVAVVVARDPGPWFDECLAGLAAQAYPELAVLVIDAASREDVRGRVAEAIPDAYVRRLQGNPGYGAAANEVLQVVEGAPFFLFLHDDVVLAPDAVRIMVEEAFRSNAGLVGPKLVQWGDERRLLSVGLTVDKTGYPAGLADRGELDQEQHDSVRDVFALAGGCILARADLFEALGGFDAAISFLGEDIDLCWRAQVVGARCVVAPDAVARHLEALSERRTDDDRRRLQTRHRVRTMLKTYGVLHLVRVFPQAITVLTLEALFALFVGRWSHARDVAGAFAWNFAHRRSLLRERRAVQRARRVPDAELRRLQMRGSARAREFLRGQLGVEERARLMAATGREMGAALAGREARVVVAGLVVLAALVAAGSRDLVTTSIPAFADFQPLPPAGHWLESWWHGWSEVGMGTDAPPPTGFVLVGAVGALLTGAMGLLQHLIVVLALPLGLLGAWGLGRRLGSLASGAATTIAYACLPVGYNAIARGSLSGLVAWAAAPWMLRRLAEATGDQPFTRDGAPRVITFGITLAILAALVPALVVLPLVLAVGLAVGGLVGGARRGAVRGVVFAGAGGIVAAVLNLPWTLDFLPPGASWAAFAGVETSAGTGGQLADLLRLDTGPVGFDLLGWAVPVAAFLPVLVVRDWRLGWAARSWGAVLVLVGVAWAGPRGWLPGGLPDTEVLLAPAAAAMALAAGCGALAFERELAAYRFGWRQAVTVLAAIALLAGAVPLFPAATSGRWRAPEVGIDGPLGFIEEDAGPGNPGFRVLWIGDPVVMPVGSYDLGDGLGYGTSVDGLPDLTQRWPGAETGATGILGDAVRVALEGDTAELGRLLGPLGVRYVAALEQAVPGRGESHPLPPPVERALAGQVDLNRIDVGPGVHLFENAAWRGDELLLPGGSGGPLGAGRLAAVLAPEARAAMDDATPLVLDPSGPASSTGAVSRAGPVLAAVDADDDWQLTVGDGEARRETALGAVNLFAAPGGGQARLHHTTDPARRAGVALQGLLWVVAGALAWRGRPRLAAPEGGSP